MSFITKQLITIPEMLQHISLIRELGPSLTIEAYEEMLNVMIPFGYGQVAIFENDKCVGISGFWISTKLYSGKYLEMDNVVVLPEYRSKGIGKILSDWCEQKAKENNCKKLMLDAWLTNEKAHKFYEREGYIKRGYHFIKDI
jgi:GNAT superfamily N-acetyltransferase